MLSVPTNCRFEIDDAEDEWTFPRKFDYIHGRALLSCFSDPKAIFQKAFDALTPGGYLEMHDAMLPFQFIDASGANTSLNLWNTLITNVAAEKARRPLTNVQHYRRWFEEIGFNDVVEKKFYWPMNPWPKGKRLKHLAAWVQADFCDGIEGWTMALFTRFLGWSKEEVHVFLAKVRNDMKNTDIHSYCTVYVRPMECISC
jgi:trans-aconitate methyltransferase